LKATAKIELAATEDIFIDKDIHDDEVATRTLIKCLNRHGKKSCRVLKQPKMKYLEYSFGIVTFIGYEGHFQAQIPQ
jgi:hypothetical protein